MRDPKGSGKEITCNCQSHQHFLKFTIGSWIRWWEKVTRTEGLSFRLFSLCLVILRSFFKNWRSLIATSLMLTTFFFSAATNRTQDLMDVRQELTPWATLPFWQVLSFKFCIHLKSQLWNLRILILCTNSIRLARPRGFLFSFTS